MVVVVVGVTGFTGVAFRGPEGTVASIMGSPFGSLALPRRSKAVLRAFVGFLYRDFFLMEVFRDFFFFVVIFLKKR